MLCWLPIRVTGVWLSLMVATAASVWWFAGNAFAPRLGVLMVILLAALKVWLVMNYFMELRTAPTAWRLATGMWLAAATTVIVLGWAGA